MVSPHRQQDSIPAPLKAFRDAIKQQLYQRSQSVMGTRTPKAFGSAQVRLRSVIRPARSHDPGKKVRSLGLSETAKHTEVSSFSLVCHVPVVWDQVGSHASRISRTKRRFDRCQVSETRLAAGSTSASTRLYNASRVISSRF